MSARLLHPLKPVYALVLALALSVAVYALTAVLQPVRAYASGSVVSDPGNPLYPNDTTHSMTVNGVSIPIKAEIVDGTTYDVAKFTFSGTADIQVDVPGGIGSYTLWPKSLNLPVTKSGNSLSFSIDNPANLMLEVGGLNKLFIFATPLETNVPSPGDPNVIYYGPGIHDVGVIQLQSGQTLYLAPGALVKGRVEGIGVSNVRIAGRGILDLRDYTSRTGKTFGIYFQNSSGITVEGIGLREANWWQSLYLKSSDIHISYTNEMGAEVNNDGIDIDGVTDMTVRGCFILSGDDGFGWHALDAATNGQPDTRNIVADNIVFYNLTAGNAIRIGASMETNLFQDITIKNSYVIHAAGAAVFSDHSDWAWVKNLNFDHFFVESTGSAGIINFKIAKTQYSNNNGFRDERGHFDGVHFRNFKSLVSGAIVFQGYDSTHLIDHVSFENVSVNGTPITSLSQMSTNSYVTNVTFPATDLSADFEAGTASGWTAASGTWSVVHDGSERYKQTYTGGEAISSAGASSLTDYALQADMKLYDNGANAGSGILARYQDSGNYYMLRLSSGNVQLYKKVGGVSTLLQAMPFSYTTDTPYTLRLEVTGSTLTGYVDGIPKVTATDSALASGAIALRTYDQTAGFDNVLVTKAVPPGSFSGDFEGGSSDGWTPVNGTWTVTSDGSYVYKQTYTGGEAISSAGSSSLADYALQADVKLYDNSTNSGSGILARYQDSGNYYMLRLSGGNVQLYKKVGGVSTLLQQTPYSYTTGTTYTLKLTLGGSTLTGYVNGVQKISVTDGSFAAGKIGLRTYQQTASFDNVSVN